MRSNPPAGAISLFIFAVATLVTFTFLFFKIDSLSGIWSGSASRYLLAYLLGFGVLAAASRFFFKSQHKAVVTLAALIFLVTNIGFAEVFSSAYFVLSCYCLGRYLLISLVERKDSRCLFLYSTIVGASICILAFSLLILIKVNSRLLYFILLAIPIFVFYLAQKNCIDAFLPREKVNSLLSQINNLNSYRYYGLLLLTVFILSYTFFPTVTWDEQALHLSLWTQLSANGLYVVDPAHQVWTAAPNTVALIHGIISLLSNSDAKSAVNFFIFLFTLFGIWSSLNVLNVSGADRLALATLFVSTPIISILLVSLQTDLFLGLCLVNIVFCVLSLERDGVLAALAGLFAGALALSAKLPGILIAGPMFLIALHHFYEKKYFRTFDLMCWLGFTFLLFAGFALAVLPYLKAYYYTGNPIFPLFNSIFESPYIGTTDFKDNRWNHGFNFESFAGLFFNATQHMEVGNNFVGGLQYFLLLPAAIVASFIFKQKKLLIISAIIGFYFLPLFYSLQYLRYFYAVMPIATVLIAVFLLGESKWVAKKFILTSIYAISVFNFCVMPGSSWLFFASPLSFLKPDATETFTNEIVPEVALNRMVSTAKDRPKVFFAHARPFGATLVGSPIYNMEYSYSYYKNGQVWSQPEDILKDFSSWGVDFVYWDQKEMFRLNDAARNLMRKFLLSYGRPVFQANHMVAFTISNQIQTYESVFVANSSAKFHESGSPLVSDSGITLHENDVLSVDVNMSAYSAFKYRVEYICENESDFFIAQLNWDNGVVFYKLLECAKHSISMEEVGAVPPGARYATVYLSARTTQTVSVSSLSLEGR